MNTLGLSPSFAIYMDLTAWQDYVGYRDWFAHGRSDGFTCMSFAEWCGVEPYRDDPYLVWC